jgi:SpoVK/Ycf46/Vps4 family AAA+-type ATPase
MNKNGYFQNIAQDLSEKKALHIPGESRFARLKKMEYWVRILRSAPQYFVLGMVKDLMDKEHQAELDQKLASFNLESPSAQENEQIQNIATEYFTKYALEQLKNAVMEDDPVYIRAQKLQETLRLSDSDMELILYLWIDLATEIKAKQSGLTRRAAMMQSRGQDVNLMLVAGGFTEKQFYDTIGDNSLLSKLRIIDSDLVMDHEIELHMNGTINISSVGDIETAEAPKIPFQTLAKDRPEADMLVYLLAHHDYKQPLNILFYGRAGTGKTELSKALAQELGIPLYTIKTSSEPKSGIIRESSLGDSILRRRVRNLQLAAWRGENEKSIILIDEADQMLNLLEKGTLNMLMEDIHVPVIWISNSMRFVEESTRRRFDYSIKFENFSAEKRAAQLHSVLENFNAPDLISEEDVRSIAAEYPVTVGGMTLAVKHALPLAGERSIASDVIRKMLGAHANLLGVKCDYSREKDTHAPAYSLSGINMEGDVNEVMEIAENFNGIWDRLDGTGAAQALNILLYGAPGTGKTEFARYLARQLNRKLIIKRSSDLKGMFVGETEKRIRDAFEEAEESKAILFFDEADSLIGDRNRAERNFEVSQVNEILTQLENFNGIFIAATNFNGTLDPASRRRFALKLGFNYLTPDGIAKMWQSFFPQQACPESVKNFDTLAPGDFNAVFSRLRYLPTHKLTAERIATELENEIKAKGGCSNRKMGF